MTSCRRHIRNACPPRCWQPGRTVFKRYAGALIFTRTYTTPEAATQAMRNDQDWLAGRIGGENCPHRRARRLNPDPYGQWSWSIPDSLPEEAPPA